MENKLNQPMPVAQPMPTREAVAMREVGHTTVSPAVARALMIAFLLAIFGVPLTQQVDDLRQYHAGARAQIRPQCYDLFWALPSTLAPLKLSGTPFVRRLKLVNRRLLEEIHSYEDTLEDQSLLGRLIRPSIQYGLTRWLGAGNEKAYCGRDQWLFYRADLDYLLGPGFLDPNCLKRRAVGSVAAPVAPQPDPRKAIRQFRDELAARGIALIIMPTPVKPAIYPEKFTASGGQHSAPLQNASYRQFVGELERDGILVFDAALELVALKQKGIPLFLEADTHWTPAAVEQTARSLKTFIEAHVFLTPAARLPYQTRHLEITRQGDIAALLSLPESYASFPPQTVNVRQILAEFGELWQSDHAAEILVLGDSFSNIYALDAMGWGKGAGLIEQLSFELGRPLDRLVMNDNGAYATRHLLVRELFGGRDRLAGKRLVIWQFSARELSFGDWRLARISH